MARAMAAFLNAAGLSEVEMTEAERLETMELLGSILREVVQGLMEVLAACSPISATKTRAF